MNSISENTANNDDNPHSTSLKGRKILIKFGGNAMADTAVKSNVVANICRLRKAGAEVAVVHGGGPSINKALEMAQVKSEFVYGHRKTTTEAMKYVEMALKGEVNGELVRLINTNGEKAVGISGKDGTTVTATKRFHMDKSGAETDLGQVGDVHSVDTKLIDLLMENGFIPVMAPVSFGEDYLDYNINADMFAGHVAAAIKADDLIMLTDVDGLRRDKDDPATLIPEIAVEDAEKEIGGIIQGGMIPKIEALVIAVKQGVKNAYIMNGTKKDILFGNYSKPGHFGTIIKK